eukprot:2447274-Pleurochrysis_carterae.AAC.5
MDATESERSPYRTPFALTARWPALLNTAHIIDASILRLAFSNTRLVDCPVAQIAQYVKRQARFTSALYVDRTWLHAPGGDIWAKSDGSDDPLFFHQEGALM